LVPENCNGHDDVMRAISKYEAQMAACSVKMDTVIKQSEQAATIQREIKRCLNELTVELAKNYVTKQEFKEFTEGSEARIVRIHERLDTDARQRKKDEHSQREFFVKVIVAVFSGGALAFAVISWLVDYFRNGGVL